MKAEVIMDLIATCVGPRKPLDLPVFVRGYLESDPNDEPYKCVLCGLVLEVDELTNHALEIDGLEGSEIEGPVVCISKMGKSVFAEGICYRHMIVDHEDLSAEFTFISDLQDPGEEEGDLKTLSLKTCNLKYDNSMSFAEEVDELFAQLKLGEDDEDLLKEKLLGMTEKEPGNYYMCIRRVGGESILINIAKKA